MYCWLSTRPELVFRTRTSSTRSVRLPTTFATISESTEEEEEPSPKSWSKNRLSIVLRGASYIGRQAYLLPVWPDLPKFGHIWLYFKSLWQYFDVFLVSGRILNLHLQCFYASGQIFVVVNGQKLKKSSHLVTLPGTWKLNILIQFISNCFNFNRSTTTTISTLLPLSNVFVRKTFFVEKRNDRSSQETTAAVSLLNFNC